MNEVALFINKAPLPVAYREACVALDRCEKLDECKEWSDRALAIASYARQSKDTTLLVVAQRIQVRAVARLGELLAEYDGRGKTEGTHGSSQREAAEAAGLSEHQQLQAVRVANVPAAERDTLIEADRPPTVTLLADLGTKHRPAGKPDPLASPWADWVFAIGHLRQLPVCGLQALVEHRELPSPILLDEAAAALANLENWIALLREDIDADRQGTD